VKNSRIFNALTFQICGLKAAAAKCESTVNLKHTTNFLFVNAAAL
jgi:hypothetical protein